MFFSSLFFTACAPYVQNLIQYQFAGIDDYKIFASRTVKAGSPQAWAIADSYNEAELEPDLIKTIESFDPVAFLVINNNQIIFERYWGEHNKTAYSASFSMAKSIVSLLLGIALEEGKIQSLDQSIADFIPEFKENEKAAITFRHLLTMTSGLAWDEAYSSPFSPTTELYYGDDLYKLVVNLPVKHKAGSVWYYSSADTQLLGIALEAALGQSLSEYASEKLWIPLGAEQDASWSLDKENGMTKANCCFNSTARDFARLGQLVLQEGNWQGEQLIPADYLKEATQPVEGLKNEQGDDVPYYGYQIWLAELDGQAMPFFNGILGQYVFILPHLDTVVVRLGNRDHPRGEDIFAYQQAALSILE